jgi:hypothetical protein
LAWNGSWNGVPDNPSAASAVSGMTDAICAASACAGGEHASRNAPLVGFREVVALRCDRVLARRGVASRRWVMSRMTHVSGVSHGLWSPR